MDAATWGGAAKRLLQWSFPFIPLTGLTVPLVSRSEIFLASFPNCHSGRTTQFAPEGHTLYLIEARVIFLLVRTVSSSKSPEATISSSHIMRHDFANNKPANVRNIRNVGAPTTTIYHSPLKVGSIRSSTVSFVLSVSSDEQGCFSGIGSPDLLVDKSINALRDRPETFACWKRLERHLIDGFRFLPGGASASSSASSSS